MLKEVECANKECSCPKSNHFKDFEGYWACLTSRCGCKKYQEPLPPPKRRDF